MSGFGIDANYANRPFAALTARGDILRWFYLWWSEAMKKPWFGAKAYGIGIGPKGLPGWLTMLVYVAAMVGVATFGEWLHPPLWIVGALFFALTIGLVAVIALTSDGKPWRWRWGDR